MAAPQPEFRQELEPESLDLTIDLEGLGLSDGIIGSDCNLSALSPTRQHQRYPWHHNSVSPSATAGAGPSRLSTMDERQPLLTGARLGGKAGKKPFYRARPMWLVPFAIIASLVRGMTLAPRVEVFTQLACGRLHEQYNHTSVIPLPTHLVGITVTRPSDHPLQFTPSNIVNHPNDDDDPRILPSAQCLSDPSVQAGAARLQTIMVTTMGTLSALTTGFWGAFGERHGRTRVLAITSLALLLTDLIFIFVSTPNTPFSGHGHKLLILAPFVEGLLGGWATLQAATTAYVSDCTGDGSRAKVFSRFTGVFYIGLTVGPMAGAFLIKHPMSMKMLGMGGKGPLPSSHPLQSVTTVFWAAIFFSFVNLLLVAFVVPESLTEEKRTKAADAHNAVKPATVAVDIDGVDIKVKKDWIGVGIVRSFLSPLGIFLPARIPVASGTSTSLNYKTDYSLTWLALALFGYMLSTGIFQVKYLYAEHVYGWGAEQLSYYISFLGGLRMVHLLFLLPLIIATFKPKAKPKKSTAVTISSGEPTLKAKPTRARLAQELHFDLLLTRLSFLIDIISHTSAIVAPLPSTVITSSEYVSKEYSQALFVATTSLSGLGCGVMPAIQSLALCILQSRALAKSTAAGTENPDTDIGVGRLFGALSVLQAVGQMILGPMLFGVIYSSTVGDYPKAIFWTASGICVASLALLSLIRPVGGARKKGSSGKGKRRDLGFEVEVEVERGRSRVSKDLRAYAGSSVPSTPAQQARDVDNVV